MRRALTALGLAATLAMAPTAAEAGPKTLDFKPHQIVTAKQANKHLTGTPKQFRKAVVAQVVKTKRQARQMFGDEAYAEQARQCQDLGKRPASIRVHGYQRGIALATINQCVLTVDGGPVVLKQVKKKWRMRYLGTAAITCQQLAGHKVSRALYLTMAPNGTCLDEETGEAVDYRG